MSVEAFGLGVTFDVKDRLSSIISRMTYKYEQLGRQMGLTGRQMDNFQNKVVDLSVSFSRFYVVGGISQMISKMGIAFMQTGINMFKSADGAVKSATEYERLYNRIQLMTDASTDQMKTLSDNAYRVGVSTMFSWNEAMEAQRLLISKSVALKDVLDGSSQSILNTTVYISEMSNKQLSLADSTNLVVMAMQKFGIKDSGGIRDFGNQLAKVTQMGAEFKDIVPYFRSLGESASNTGASMQEIIAMLPIMMKMNITPKSAGQKTKGFFDDLVSIQKKIDLNEIRQMQQSSKVSFSKHPSLGGGGGHMSPTVALFKSMGINMWGKNGEISGQDIISQFLKKLSGQKPEQMAKTLAVLNIKGKDFIEIMNKSWTNKDGTMVSGIQNYAKALDELSSKNVKGLLEKNSETIRNSMAGVENLWKSVMESLSTIIGRPLIEIKKNIMRSIAEPLDVFLYNIKDTVLPQFIAELGIFSATAIVAGGGFVVLANQAGMFLFSLKMLLDTLKVVSPLLISFIAKKAIIEGSDLLSGIISGGSSIGGVKTRGLGDANSISTNMLVNSLGGFPSNSKVGSPHYNISGSTSQLAPMGIFATRNAILKDIEYEKNHHQSLIEGLNDGKKWEQKLTSKETMGLNNQIKFIEKEIMIDKIDFLQKQRQDFHLYRSQLSAGKSKFNFSDQYLQHREVSMSLFRNKQLKDYKAFQQSSIIGNKKDMIMDLLVARKLVENNGSKKIVELEEKLKDLNKTIVKTKMNWSDLGKIAKNSWTYMNSPITGGIPMMILQFGKWLGIIGLVISGITILVGLLNWKNFGRAFGTTMELLSQDPERIKKRLRETAGGDVYDQFGVSLAKGITYSQILFSMLGQKYEKHHFAMNGQKKAGDYDSYQISGKLARAGLAQGITKEEFGGMARLAQSLQGIWDSLNKLVGLFTNGGDIHNLFNDLIQEITWQLDGLPETMKNLNEFIKGTKLVLDTISKSLNDFVNFVTGDRLGKPPSYNDNFHPIDFLRDWAKNQFNYNKNPYQTETVDQIIKQSIGKIPTKEDRIQSMMNNNNPTTNNNKISIAIHGVVPEDMMKQIKHEINKSIYEANERARYENQRTQINSLNVRYPSVMGIA